MRIQNPPVFEVDRFDWFRRIGWSVLVQGTAQLLTIDEEEDLDEEIPFEFDVPLEAEDSVPAALETPSTNGGEAAHLAPSASATTEAGRPRSRGRRSLRRSPGESSSHGPG